MAVAGTADHPAFDAQRRRAHPLLIGNGCRIGATPAFQYLVRSEAPRAVPGQRLLLPLPLITDLTIDFRLRQPYGVGTVAEIGCQYHLVAIFQGFRCRVNIERHLDAVFYPFHGLAGNIDLGGQRNRQCEDEYK